MDACKKGMPEIEEHIEKEKQKLLDGYSDSQAMKDLNLSPEEMRKSLKNSNDKFNDFAVGDLKISAKIIPEEEIKKILDGLAEVIEKHDEDNIANTDQDAGVKLEALMGNPKIAAADTILNASSANKAVTVASNEELKSIFDSILDDPAMMKMLLEANPGLLDKLKCQKNPADCKKL